MLLGGYPLLSAHRTARIRLANSYHNSRRYNNDSQKIIIKDNARKRVHATPIRLSLANLESSGELSLFDPKIQ